MPSVPASSRQTSSDTPPPDLDLADALERLDPVVLGGRIRAMRSDQKLTQARVVGDAISVAYLSRIEAGTRRPNLKVLRVLARNLGTTPHELLLGLSPMAWSERRLELDWAQLSLRTGDAAGALEKTTRLLADIPATLPLGRVARHVHALALEASGDFERATIVLEELVDALPDEDDAELVVLASLTRCYRYSGELGRAIEVGRRASRRLSSMGLEGSPEAVRLALTVAMAHAETGDVGYASRLCQKALRAAEALDTSFERAGCYWNSSIIEALRGRHEHAVELAQRALIVLDEADSARNAARLRSELGELMLRLDPPDLDGALNHLRRAEQELASTDTSVADRASNRLSQSRALLLQGDLVEARKGAEEALESVMGSAPMETADALALLGQISMAEGDVAAARLSYVEATEVLAAWNDNHSAAQLWFELGGLCLSVGDQASALEAFQRAGSASGLRSAARGVVSTATVA